MFIIKDITVNYGDDLDQYDFDEEMKQHIYNVFKRNRCLSYKIVRSIKVEGFCRFLKILMDDCCYYTIYLNESDGLLYSDYDVIYEGLYEKILDEIELIEQQTIRKKYLQELII